jgi:prophage regulatory protein
LAIHLSTKEPMSVFRLPQVLQATALSRSTVYAMMADDRFPKPMKLGERAVGWPEAEIAAWLESRKAARDAA